jgi:Uncharacterised protein family (UPF0180)
MIKIRDKGFLINIHRVLREKGYDVAELNSGTDMQNVDCCVVSGLDENVMGMKDALSKGSVIETRAYQQTRLSSELKVK